jgi:hypothetical protein
VPWRTLRPERPEVAVREALKVATRGENVGKCGFCLCKLMWNDVELR